ncbi:MAG: phospholipase D family protein [Gemmataceae bacterium]
MLFTGRDIWQQIDQLREQEGPLKVAVAFLSSNRRFRLRSGDIAIVNATDGAIRTGQTSARVLARAVRDGASIYSNPKLHAKVFIAPNVVLAGSANVSDNSPSLDEAGIVSADPLDVASARSWFDALLTGSVPVNEVFLRRIEAIPVVRSGRGRHRNQTLAQALHAELPLLKDYFFGWHERSSRVRQRVVRDEAIERGVIAPGTPRNAWDWYEWEFEPGLLEIVRAECRGKPGIDFAASRDRDGTIGRFLSLDTQTWNFIDAFEVVSGGIRSIILLVLRQGSPGLRLARDPWHRQLLARLNRGLRADARVRDEISDRRSGLIEPEQLVRLYRAGAR